MGGHQAGEVASKRALRAVQSFVRRTLAFGHKNGGPVPMDASLLVEGIRVANRRIFRLAQARDYLAGMGTTVTAVMVAGGQLYLGHVGDSRAYLIRKGAVYQLTEDHSLVGELVKKGDLSRDEAMVHPQRHVLTRALGIERDTEVDTGQQALEEGDRILLATDGITNLIRPEEMAQLAGPDTPLNTLVERLVDLANERGGPDNATAILVQV